MTKSTEGGSKTHGRRLLANFFSLSAMQAVSYGVQFLTIPYIFTTIGAERNAIVFVALVQINYFFNITDYGFYLTATQAVALSRDNQPALVRIFNEVFFSKLLITAVGFVVFMAVTLFALLDVYSEHWLLFALSYSMVIGYALFPVWFYQGIEQMKTVTILNIITRMVYAACVFLFIKSPEDYLWINAYNGAAYLAVGLLALIMAVKKHNITLNIPTSERLFLQIKNSWHVFISYFTNNIYATSSVFILSFFAPVYVVGWYGAVDKIISGLRQVYNVAFLAIFPHSTALSQQNFKVHQQFLSKIRMLLLAFYVVVCSIIAYFATEFVELLTKENISESAWVVRVGMIILIAIALQIKGYQNLLIYNRKKIFARLFISAAIFNILLGSVAAWLFQEKGIISVAVVTELSVAAVLLITDYKYFNPKKQTDTVIQ